MVTRIEDKTNAMRKNNLLEAILSELSETRFNKIEHVSETGSTNSDLVLKAPELPNGFILVADYQTGGRGRLMRDWEAPPSKNLLFSVLLHPNWLMERHQLATPALALSTVEALENLGLRATIKWPNDVMVESEGDKKIAGILAEYTQQKVPALVVGMGLNIEWPYQEESAPPNSISLKACGIEKDRWEILIEILKNFEKRLLEISLEKGTSTFRQAHIDKSATLGNQVKVEKSNGDIEGRAIDIEEDGSLVVENENGITLITAGDVIHLRKL